MNILMTAAFSSPFPKALILANCVFFFILLSLSLSLSLGCLVTVIEEVGFSLAY